MSTRVLFPLVVAGLIAGAAPARALTLHNVLGHDQRSETLRIIIDDGQPITLRVDEKQPEAAVELPTPGASHRYRLEGEAIDDAGQRVVIAGAGLIVTRARMDQIAEAPNSATEAFNAYRALVDELRPFAPAEDLRVLEPGPTHRADAAAIADAEKRLKVTLPEGYKRLVTEVGAFRIHNGDYLAGAVLAPDELRTVADYAADELRDNGSEPDEVAEARARAGKRFPDAARDVVLEVFSLDEPTVLSAKGHCGQGEAPLLFPESDYTLVTIEPGDNPFMALIDYEDDIVGELRCMSYHRAFAYALHDQLITMGDAVLYLRDDTDAHAALIRARESDGKIWMALVDQDGGDDDDDDED